MTLISLGLVTLVAGCVAQQADVVRIKRELDAKISQLDKSKTSLQQAVTDANEALEKANSLIARQREEIQDLLKNRAEIMDQVANLKDTDLSQVRGAIEKNQHRVGDLDQKYLLLDTKIQKVESTVQESQESIEPLVQKLRVQLTAEEQLRVEQGGKLGEFRTSLVGYQQVLATLRQNVAKQEQQVAALHQHVDRLGQKQDKQFQQVQIDVKGVQQHIQTVIGTLEQISTTFSGRLDAYEHQLSRTSQSPRVTSGSSAPDSSASLDKMHTQQPSLANLSGLTTVPSGGSQESLTRPKLYSRNSGPGTVVVNAAPSAQPKKLSSPVAAPSSNQNTTQDERMAYQQAFKLLQATDYHGAAKEFSRFLRAFPNSALAANSQYWLGECYYGQRRFQEAIDEFERVFAFYPSSNKVPASLLKIGYSHLELRQPSIARSVFQQLVRTYPQSQAAIKAHGRLQEVNALLQNPS